MRILLPTGIIMAVILLLGLSLNIAWSADEESLGRQAEEAGKLREALMHYVSALQSVPERTDADQQFREKIINLFQRISRLPLFLMRL